MPRREVKRKSRRDVLRDSLLKYYDRTGLKTTFCNSIGRRAAVSLRILDWYCTNFAKKNHVVYETTGKDGVPYVFIVWKEYKAQLRGFSKKFFDPFCRTAGPKCTERLEFDDGNGKRVYTTIAQLNFFKWAFSNDVLTHVIRDVAIIERDMLDSLKERDESEKRKELSRAAARACTKIYSSVVIKF
jgi:hypothetical protein